VTIALRQELNVIATVPHKDTFGFKLQLTAARYFAFPDSGGDTQTHCDRGPDLRLCVRSVGASIRTIGYATDMTGMLSCWAVPRNNPRLPLS
jgi:hypothetical protein